MHDHCHSDISLCKQDNQKSPVGLFMLSIAGELFKLRAAEECGDGRPVIVIVINL
jgi:hypothetical protein